MHPEQHDQFSDKFNLSDCIYKQLLTLKKMCLPTEYLPQSKLCLLLPYPHARHQLEMRQGQASGKPVGCSHPGHGHRGIRMVANWPKRRSMYLLTACLRSTAGNPQRPFIPRHMGARACACLPPARPDWLLGTRLHARLTIRRMHTTRHCS